MRWFETDVSGLPTGPISEGQTVQQEIGTLGSLNLEDGTDR
jgi:hypothetical protein